MLIAYLMKTNNYNFFGVPLSVERHKVESRIQSAAIFSPSKNICVWITYTIYRCMIRQDQWKHRNYSSYSYTCDTDIRVWMINPIYRSGKVDVTDIKLVFFVTYYTCAYDFVTAYNKGYIPPKCRSLGSPYPINCLCKL